MSPQPKTYLDKFIEKYAKINMFAPTAMVMGSTASCVVDLVTKGTHGGSSVFGLAACAALLTLNSKAVDFREATAAALAKDLPTAKAEVSDARAARVDEAQQIAQTLSQGGAKPPVI